MGTRSFHSKMIVKSYVTPEPDVGVTHDYIIILYEDLQFFALSPSPLHAHMHGRVKKLGNNSI